MVNFSSDNASGVAPEIMRALAEANTGTAKPYGEDAITARVETRLAEIFETEVVVFPVATGTAEALARLAPIADLLLPPNRPIVRPVDDSVRVARAGPGQVGHVGVEINLARFAAVFGISDVNIPWTIRSYGTQIMERTITLRIAVAAFSALWTSPPPVYAGAMLDRWLRQLAGMGDPLSGIGNIFTRSHGSTFLPLQERSAGPSHKLEEKSRLFC